MIKIPAAQRVFNGSIFFSRDSPITKNNDIMEARKTGKRRPVKIAYTKTKIPERKRAGFLFNCKILRKRKTTTAAKKKIKRDILI